MTFPMYSSLQATAFSITGVKDSFVANKKGRKTGEREREERKWKEGENSAKQISLNLPASGRNLHC